MFHFVFFQLEELEPLFFQELKYQNNTTPFYGIKEEYNAGAKAIYISIRNELAFSRKKLQTDNMQEKFSSESCKEQNALKTPNKQIQCFRLDFSFTEGLYK